MQSRCKVVNPVRKGEIALVTWWSRRLNTDLEQVRMKQVTAVLFHRAYCWKGTSWTKEMAEVVKGHYATEVWKPLSKFAISDIHLGTNVIPMTALSPATMALSLALSSATMTTAKSRRHLNIDPESAKVGSVKRLAILLCSHFAGWKHTCWSTTKHPVLPEFSALMPTGPTLYNIWLIQK